MTRRRIAYLCLETPREGQATHTHVHEIINGLQASGWNVDLFATGSGGASSGSSLFRRALDYVRTQGSLLRRLRSLDGIYMRIHPAAWPSAQLARLIGIPVFQELNGKPDDVLVTYPSLKALGSIMTWLYTSQLRRADHVFVVTDGLRNWVENFVASDRITVIPNGANVAVFCPDGPRLEIDQPYVAFVGGLTAWHGLGVMVAAARSHHWPAGVALIIIGDGVERDTLKVQADGKRIRWLGRLPQVEVAGWLRGALGALSITQDTTGHLETGVAPLKLFEAMATGTAVIVTDLPFQADLVRRENAGIVIPMTDPDALARAVAILAANPVVAREMGAHGAAYVRANASWQARSDETGQIMAEVIDARR